MDAILSATALGGDIMLHSHELGKVQPGFYADLIVVDGNPLDDISLLSGHEHIDMVMINGRVHKEAYKVSLVPRPEGRMSRDDGDGLRKPTISARRTHLPTTSLQETSLTRPTV